MANTVSKSPLVLISATGAESSQPSVLEFSRFLYQIHLSYEIARLATDPRYASFHFPEYTFTPQVSRLDWQDRLSLDAVTHESPWRIKSSFVALGAIAPTLWLLAQTFEKIGNYELNREQVRVNIQEVQTRIRNEQLSNIEKARQLKVSLNDDELTATAPGTRHSVLNPIETETLRSMLAKREANQFYERSQHTLESLPFRVRALHFDLAEPKDSENGKK